MEQQISNTAFRQTKAKIAMAFKVLRNRGILARMDFECCQSCGRSQMEIDAKAKEAAGDKIHGFAFYHGQNEYHLWRTGKVPIIFDYTGDETDEVVSEALGPAHGTMIFSL